MIPNYSRYGLRAFYGTLLALGLVVFIGCSAQVAARRPSLAEARAGSTPQTDDTVLAAGEIRAEVTEVDPVHREIRVIWTDGGRRDIIPYDLSYTRVMFHGYNYPVDALQPGDLVAFVPSPRAALYIDTVRIQVPVQARAPGSPYARAPVPGTVTRARVVEGTVERIDYDRGVFDMRPREGGRMITIALPYNARGADIDNFRRLRNGDYVRVEGEFVNADNVQLTAFVR
ncbi:MAG TPA: hypothetical protein VKH64_13940 [Candidatus Binatia bacterium]|nr:hypothetical protein [Candidatus Binatia bacterium]